jgi:predicted transcriptional regulator
MDIVYQLSEASVHDVAERMSDDPGYDSVRVLLGILAKKGHLTRRRDGRRYLYSPTLSHAKATRSAVQNLLHTFFQGSPSKAILTMLDMSSRRLSQRELDDIATELDAIAELIDKGKKP